MESESGAGGAVACGLSNGVLQARRERAFARGLASATPIYVREARGSEIWDVEGRRYIDFASGIAVCNTGHLHRDVLAAAQAQLMRFSHTCLMVTPYEAAVALAERLNTLVPTRGPRKTTFVTTGAEAVENAVKIARAHTGRRGIIAFDGGYHGRTYMAMGLTGKLQPYKTGFGPFPSDVFRVPFPIPAQGVTDDDCLKALHTLFATDLPAGDCAAIIIEPVQGEGGFHPAGDGFLRSLRTLCDQHGILLIFDEIQTGIGRTGRLFAGQWSGVEPDMMTLAKGMAGGFPLAVVVGQADIMDAPAPGGLGGTYAGFPVACAAALAVLDVVERGNLADAALRIGALLADRLSALQRAHPDRISEVRADRGAMLAVELVTNGRPDPTLARGLTQACARAGLILLTCGFHGNAVRFLPALTISPQEIQDGLDIFCTCFDQLVDHGATKGTHHD